MVAAGGDQYDYDTNCNSANLAGHCRVFAYDAGLADWAQRGTDIRGGAAGDKMGLGIAINADGTVLACGAPYSDVQASNGGEVQVYEYNAASDEWELIGAPISGTVSKQWLGFNVALNAAGNILAVGSPGTNTLSNDGAVAVYQRVTTRGFYLVAPSRATRTATPITTTAASRWTWTRRVIFWRSAARMVARGRSRSFTTTRMT